MWNLSSKVDESKYLEASEKREKWKIIKMNTETKKTLFTSLSENIKESTVFTKMKWRWNTLSKKDQSEAYKMWAWADPTWKIMHGFLSVFPSAYTIFRHVKSSLTFEDFKLKAWANEMSFILRTLVQMNLLELKLEDWMTKEKQVNSIKKDIESDSKVSERYTRLLEKAIKLFVPWAKTFGWELKIANESTRHELENFKEYLMNQQLARLNSDWWKIIQMNTQKIRQAA